MENKHIQISEIIGKTVGAVADEQDLKIKLGAENGSAFIYCGDIKGIEFAKIDKAICQSYKSRIEMAKKKIALVEKAPKDMATFLAKTYPPVGNEEDGKKIKERYEKWLGKFDHDIKLANKTITKTTDRLAGYTSIAERKITEVYPSIDEEDTFCILYEGSENGDYWITEEYTNDTGKNANGNLRKQERCASWQKNSRKPVFAS